MSEDGCSHVNKAHSSVLLLTDPPQRPFICIDCLFTDSEYIKSPLDNGSEYEKLMKLKLANDVDKKEAKQ
jgi:hypothetical protein